MCGLVAVISKHKQGLSSRNLDIFEQLLWLDSLRGEDSTGVFSVDFAGNVQIVKEASDSNTFLKAKEFKDWREKAVRSGWAVVGHNRKATRGTINDENAHPFWVEDKMVLVHNGTMYGDHKHLADVEVDSHAIAHLFAEEKDVSVALGKINAAYAFIWYDVAAKQLRLIRNAQRPLHFMEGHDAYYIASEAEMLTFVKSRMSVSLEKDKDIWMFKEMSLHEWTLNGRDAVLEHRDIKEKVTPAVAITPNAISMYGYDEDEYGNGWETWWQKQNRRYYGEDTPKPPLRLLEPPRTIPEEIIHTWTQFHTMEQWEHLKDMYPNKSKLKVGVMDFVITDDVQEHVFAIGKGMDRNGLLCTFPIRKKMMDVLTKPGEKLSGIVPVFEIEVDSCRWQKVDKDGRGRATIIGLAGASFITDGKTMVQ